MRFYKITDSETVLKALAFIERCDKLQKENEKKLKEIVPFEWVSYFGHGMGSGFNLLVDYEGFVPKNKAIIQVDGWKKNKDDNTVFVPNKVTKKGKEDAKKLSELNKVWYREVFDVIDIKQEDLRRFTVPRLFLSKDKTEIYFKTSFEQKIDVKRFEEVTLTYVESKLY